MWVGRPAGLHEGVWSRTACLRFVLFRTITGDNLFLKCDLVKWHQFRERLLAMPHLPHHNAKTVDICSFRAIHPVFQYFRREVNDASLRFFKCSYDANISYLCCEIFIHLKCNTCVLHQHFEIWLNYNRDFFINGYQ